MPYYDGTCDECGDQADIESPMYCLCNACYGGDDDFEDDDFEDEFNHLQGG